MRAGFAHEWGVLNHVRAMRVCWTAAGGTLCDAHGGGQNDGGIRMSIDWQNGAPDRGRTLLPESFKPKALRLATAAESAAESYVSAASAQPLAPALPVAPAQPLLAVQPAPEQPPEPAEAAEPQEQPAPPVVDLGKLEAALGRKRLDEIADF